MLLRPDSFTPYEYRPVTLPQLDLELGDNSTLVVSLDGQNFLPLEDTAFEQLVGYLGAPVGFARKLRNAGRGHVLAYLHKQLAETSGDKSFVSVLHPEKGMVGLAEKERLFFTGMDAVELDRRMGDMLADAKSPFTLKAATESQGEVRYLFFAKDPHEVLEDTVGQGESLRPLWRWGFELRHSLWGTQEPAFHVSLERMVCSNLTYMPEDTYLYNLSYDSKVDVRLQEVTTFLGRSPDPNWSQLGRFIDRTKRQQASVAEVKKVRSKLKGLFKGVDDEASGRLEDQLGWKDIVDAYGLKDMDEKPTPQWFKRASTPHNLYDLYNMLTREATHAPNTVDQQKRQDLLVFAGRLLAEKPDLEDMPPRIDWDQRAVERKSAYTASTDRLG